MSMNSHEPADKIAMVREIAKVLGESEDPCLQWASRRCLAYLDSKGADLGECLGLRPRQGGRYETPWELSRQAKRDRMIREVAHLIPGAVTAKASTLADWIAAGGPPPECGAFVVARYRELLEAFPDVSLGDRQLVRILKGETVAARRHKSAL